MSDETLHANAVGTNNGCLNPTNALGAPDNVWTTNDGGDEDWDAWFGFANPSRSLSGTQSIEALARKDSTGGNGDVGFSVQLYEGATFVRNLGSGTLTDASVPNGVNIGGTFDASEISDHTNIMVRVTATGPGGMPAGRRSGQVDAFTFEVTLAPPGQDFNATLATSTSAGLAAEALGGVGVSLTATLATAASTTLPGSATGTVSASFTASSPALSTALGLPAAISHDWDNTTLITEIEPTTYTDEDLESGTWYRYRVRSSDGSAASEWSDWVQGVTEAGATGDFDATLATATSTGLSAEMTGVDGTALLSDLVDNFATFDTNRWEHVSGTAPTVSNGMIDLGGDEFAGNGGVIRTQDTYTWPLDDAIFIHVLQVDDYYDSFATGIWIHGSNDHWSSRHILATWVAGGNRVDVYFRNTDSTEPAFFQILDWEVRGLQFIRFTRSGANEVQVHVSSDGKTWDLENTGSGLDFLDVSLLVSFDGTWTTAFVIGGVNIADQIGWVTATMASSTAAGLAGTVTVSQPIALDAILATATSTGLPGDFVVAQSTTFSSTLATATSTAFPATIEIQETGEFLAILATALATSLDATMVGVRPASLTATPALSIATTLPATLGLHAHAPPTPFPHSHGPLDPPPHTHSHPVDSPHV